MNLITLPPRPDGSVPPVLPESRQITLVGAAGAGKSSFMQRMIADCGDRAYRVSALEAFYSHHGCNCETNNTAQSPDASGSVAAQYRRMAAERPYLRDDAPTDLDRLVCLLLTDEFEHLLDLKIRLNQGESLPSDTAPTRLDTLRSLWERIFPSNRIVRAAGSLMFETSAGSDLIDTRRLSRGERTVLYHIAAVLYAPQGAVVFVEEPTLFVHPAILNNLWTSLERLRPDCRFIYDSVDVDFVNSRTANIIIWVKSYDASSHAWDYEMLPASHLSDDFFIDLIGTRKPVLFIEGDAERSIDARLYALVFSDYTVRPLGSCDRVIEATRTFGSLRPMHHLDSHGIVDRDRRTDIEVAYLRRKGIDVPEVAEIENIFLTEGVIRVMAEMRGRNADRVVGRVKKAVLNTFKRHIEQQALQHVRYRVKREAECKIDARFSCITAMELHLSRLVERLRPRELYNSLVKEFKAMVTSGNYAGILKVFNHKPMLGDSGVATLLGYKNRDEYINGVLDALRNQDSWSQHLVAAVRDCFTLPVPVENAGKGNKNTKVVESSGKSQHKRHQ
ncbi:MAG: DUF4435 domain-containing protein [Muribaculaceae bacterium]|nr:DUF4435 domain-containing protein [Muribaculaceae bacterium]